MELEKFLEKYNVVMSQKEIEEISNSKLRSIKMKYWNKMHEAFMNEKEIKDNRLEIEYNKIKENEKKELEECYNECYVLDKRPKEIDIEIQLSEIEKMTDGQLSDYIAEDICDYDD